MRLQYLILFTIVVLPFSGCLSNSSSPSQGYSVCDGYSETGSEAMAITWNAIAENTTNSDEDVLMNIKLSNPCDASEFFYLNGSSSCSEGGANCIESIQIKTTSNDWEICTPSTDSSCTITINNGTSWDDNDLIIVKENGADLFSEEDVVGETEYQDWEIIWVEQLILQISITMIIEIVVILAFVNKNE